MQKIDIKTIKHVPVVFGEADVIKVVTTLPGVKTVGEASTGLNVDHQFDKNNSISLTGYLSKDRFNLNSDTAFNYQNQNLSLRWKRTFNKKLNAQFAGGLDKYEYSIASEKNPINAYRLKFNIDHEGH